MTTIKTPTLDPPTNPLETALTSARYLVDTTGSKTDVVLPLPVWKDLLLWLEELDDLAIAQEWLPRLQANQVLCNGLMYQPSGIMTQQFSNEATYYGDPQLPTTNHQPPTTSNH